jgi:hypothetical protein
LDGHPQTKDSWCTKIQQNPQAHQRFSHTSAMLTDVNREKHGKAMLNHHFPRCFLPPDLVLQQWLEPTAAWQHFWMTDANGGFFELYLAIVYMLL